MAWDDATTGRIPKSCHTAIGGGRLLIVEQVPPDGAPVSVAKLVDLEMRAAGMAGKRRRLANSLKRLQAIESFRRRTNNLHVAACKQRVDLREILHLLGSKHGERIKKLFKAPRGLRENQKAAAVGVRQVLPAVRNLPRRKQARAGLELISLAADFK
jgi:hypothetical protein